MRKQNYLQIEIDIPLSEGRVPVGKFEVSAHYTKAGEFDINYIKYGGVDQYPSYKAAGEAGQPMIDYVKAALRNHYDNLDSFERFQMERYGNVLVSERGLYEEDHDEFNDRLATWADLKASDGEIAASLMYDEHA